MPRRRTQSRAVALGAVTVLALVGIMVLLSVLVSRGSVKTSLGDQDFWAGRTDRLAAEIRDRGPFLVPDASPSRRRDVYIQHLGRDDTRGWLAFDAHAPGQDDRSCSLRWSGRDFVDPCGEARFPANGAGLRRYRTRVTGGNLYVVFKPVSGQSRGARMNSVRRSATSSASSALPHTVAM
jgi:hypothetical protein